MVSRENPKTGEMEGFGKVYLEAGACCKPVIAGRGGGVEDAVIDQVTGLLVDPENLQEVADTILKILLDKDLAKKLGEAGFKITRQPFRWDFHWESKK